MGLATTMLAGCGRESDAVRCLDPATVETNPDRSYGRPFAELSITLTTTGRPNDRISVAVTRASKKVILEKLGLVAGVGTGDSWRPITHVAELRGAQPPTSLVEARPAVNPPRPGSRSPGSGQGDLAGGRPFGPHPLQGADYEAVVPYLCPGDYIVRTKVFDGDDTAQRKPPLGFVEALLTVAAPEPEATPDS